MTDIERLNERLESSDLRLVVHSLIHDEKPWLKYCVWFEYRNKKGGWGILHNLGNFRTEGDVIESAKRFLNINKYRY